MTTICIYKNITIHNGNAINGKRYLKLKEHVSCFYCVSDSNSLVSNLSSRDSIAYQLTNLLLELAPRLLWYLSLADQATPTSVGDQVSPPVGCLGTLH